MLLALAAGAALAMPPTPHPAPTETPPVCERVLVAEESGNGPNYYVKLCGDRRLPVHLLIVDGGAFPERPLCATPPLAARCDRIRAIVFWQK
jgi:hypothetical protein